MKVSKVSEINFNNNTLQLVNFEVIKDTILGKTET